MSATLRNPQKQQRLFWVSDMSNKDKYAFFIDIDGTLYPHGIIPMKNRSAIKQARQAGHFVFINTARSMGNMPPKVKNLKVDGFICSLGCNIVLNGQTARLVTLEPKELARIFDIMNSNGDSFVFEGEKQLICNDSFAAYDDSDEILPAADGRDFLHKFSDQPVAKVFVHGQMTQRSFEQLSPDYNIIQHKNYAEFGIKGCDKATGIKFVESLLGLDRKKCVAIGDSKNDLDMMKYCGISVAVGNASQQVKEMCDIVTLDAAQGGVGQAITDIISK